MKQMLFSSSKVCNNLNKFIEIQMTIPLGVSAVHLSSNQKTIY